MLEVDEAYKQLGGIAESYITFFRKRAELEQQYLSELDKILAKQDESDRRLLDAFFADSSLSNAWTQIKATVYAESLDRRQLLYSLQHGVIEPLVAFRDSKERQRKRIKEETQSTATEHSEYKAHTIRLKRTYQRRSEDVRALTIPDSTPPDASTSAGTGNASNPGSSATNSAGSLSGGSTSQERSPIVSGATSTSLRDNLSPPPLSNAALSALKSSRSQLNSLINKLGAGPYRGGGGSDNLKPSNLSYRLSKAKRDAEEADAAYRSALHHLETLRMQRERVSKASMGSLQEFAFEFSTTCKSIFSQYCDSWAAKARSAHKACDSARLAAHTISPEDDVVKFASTANVAVFYEEPLPYENYHVGVSYSLIFGVSLNEYSAANDGMLVPLTIQRAILEVDARGLETEGIYRIPGKMGLIQQVVQEIEQDEVTFEFSPEKHDVHTVTGVLKLYLRQLPEPLLPIDAKERELISTSSADEAFKLVSKKLRKVSPTHQAVAKMLVAHFERVLAHSATNKMSTQALSLCLNPVIFPEETATSLSALSLGQKDTCLEFIIAHRQELFAGLPVIEASGNHPYRQQRLSGSSADFSATSRAARSSNIYSSPGNTDPNRSRGSMQTDEDDDEDPPFRKSAESNKALSSAKSSTTPAQVAGEAGVLQQQSATSYYSDLGKGDVYSPKPRVSSATSYNAPFAQAGNTGDLSRAISPSPAPAPMPIDIPQPVPMSALSPPLGSPLAVEQQQQQLSPKRAFSQRARSGSATLVNVVKNLARKPSGSAYPSYTAPQGGAVYGHGTASSSGAGSNASLSSASPTSPYQSPTSPGIQAALYGPRREGASLKSPVIGASAPKPQQYDSQTSQTMSPNTSQSQPNPLFAKQPTASNSHEQLPAGAAPLLTSRPSNVSITNLTAQVADPASSVHASRAMTASPSGLGSRSQRTSHEGSESVDPDGAYESYLEAAAAEEESAKHHRTRHVSEGYVVSAGNKEKRASRASLAGQSA